MVFENEKTKPIKQNKTKQNNMRSTVSLRKSDESYSELLSSSDSAWRKSPLRICQKLILDYQIPLSASRVNLNLITAVLASFFKLRSEFLAAVNSSWLSVFVKQLQDEAINFWLGFIRSFFKNLNMIMFKKFAYYPKAFKILDWAVRKLVYLATKGTLDRSNESLRTGVDNTGRAERVLAR